MRDESVRPTGGVRVAVSPWGGVVEAAPGDVRVWVIPLTTPPVGVEELLADLTADERARAERYRVQKGRHEFVVGRGLLRRILGERLGVAAVDVPITTTGAGKPVLAGAPANLHFNVSHTDGLALIALADRPVGIDTEQVRVMSNPDGLVRRFFTPLEQETYHSLPAELRRAGFFRGWTSKEAVIKAAGLGVGCLEEFDVEMHPDRPAAVLGARHPGLVGSVWALTAWEPSPGFAAAVAVADDG